jgi:hypothetical protein
MRVELEWDERLRIAEWAQNEIKEIGRGNIVYGDAEAQHDALTIANEILKKVSDD